MSNTRIRNKWQKDETRKIHGCCLVLFVCVFDGLLLEFCPEDCLILTSILFFWVFFVFLLMPSLLWLVYVFLFIYYWCVLPVVICPGIDLRSGWLFVCFICLIQGTLLILLMLLIQSLSTINRNHILAMSSNWLNILLLDISWL